MKEIRQLYCYITDKRILEEIAVIDDFYRNDRRGLVGAQKFGGRFPDRSICMFKKRSGVYRAGVVTDEKPRKGVKLSSEGFACVKVFRLVESQADNTDS